MSDEREGSTPQEPSAVSPRDENETNRATGRNEELRSVGRRRQEAERKLEQHLRESEDKRSADDED